MPNWAAIKEEYISNQHIDYIMDDFDTNFICKINDLECNNKIPEEMYLVLGDNRQISAYSRIKGLIKKDQILGKTIFRIWPLNRISITK